MKSLVAANDEKVGYPESENLSSLFLVTTAGFNYAVRNGVCASSLVRCDVKCPAV